MKKVIGQVAKIVFALFSVAMIGMLMVYTFDALGYLFPNDIGNQIWGMLLFDVAAIAWALAFVFESRSLGQYAYAAIGFGVAFFGTLGMVAADVMLAGTQFTEQTAEIGKWMTYGFIFVTVMHAALIYAHHGAAPTINEEIRLGIARGEIVTHAMDKAEKGLEVKKDELAEVITADIIARVQRDLALGISMPARQTIVDAKALPVEDSLIIPASSPSAQEVAEQVPFPVSGPLEAGRGK